MNLQDLSTMAVGALAWTAAIVPVKLAGSACAADDDAVVRRKGRDAFNRGVCVLFGIALAAVTTPALSYLCGWKTSHDRVRGIAIALGTAQTIDGLTHIFNPSFYATNKSVSIACAGNIFFGAGLLGIFSAYM
jgi:cytochrome c biogenesis protein CcdA